MGQLQLLTFFFTFIGMAVAWLFIGYLVDKFDEFIFNKRAYKNGYRNYLTYWVDVIVWPFIFAVDLVIIILWIVRNPKPDISDK